MAGSALAKGLELWAGSAFALAAGLGAALAVAAAGYAAIVWVSPDGPATLAAFAAVAGLALAGWWRFCARIAEGGAARRSDLADGFARPLRGLAAGLGPVAVIAAPAWLALRAAEAFAPGFGAWAALAAGWAAAPAALAIPFAAMAPRGERAPGWSRGLALAPAIAALAALGPALWWLLETRARAGFESALPDIAAPYGLGILRLVGVAGALLSASAAGCVWAAACVAPDDGGEAEA